MCVCAMARCSTLSLLLAVLVLTPGALGISERRTTTSSRRRTTATESIASGGEHATEAHSSITSDTAAAHTNAAAAAADTSLSLSSAVSAGLESELSQAADQAARMEAAALTGATVDLTAATTAATSTTADQSVQSLALTTLNAELASDLSSTSEAVPAAPNDVIFGRTTPGRTPWRRYGHRGIYVDVDTSIAGFTSTPVYVCNLGGDGNNNFMWGASSIYHPKKSSFRVYIYNPHGYIHPNTANRYRWHINWAATTNPLYGGTTQTAWTQHSRNSIQAFTSVQSAVAKGQRFTKDSTFITSITGRTSHWMTLGSADVYYPSPTGFRTYVYCPWRVSARWARYHAHWEMTWIATDGRGSFQSGRSSRMAWRTIGPGHFITSTFKSKKPLQKNAVWVVTMSGFAWTARGQAATRISGPNGARIDLQYTPGVRYAQRYNYQINFIGQNPYGDLLKAEIAALTQRVKVVASTSNNLGRAVAKLSNEVKSAKASANSKALEVVKEKRGISSASSDISALGRKRRGLTRDISRLARKGRDIKRQLDSSTRGLRGKVKSLTAEADRLSTKESTLTKDLEAATQQLNKLTDDRTQVESELNAVKSKIGPEQTSLTRDQGDFKTRADTLKQQLQSATELHGLASQRLDKVNAQVTALKQTVADIQSKKVKVEEEIETMQRKISDSKANMESLYTEATNTRTELSAIRKQFATKTQTDKTALTSEESEKEQLESSTRMLSEEAEREAAKAKEAEDQLVKLQQESHDTRADLRNKIQATERGLKELQVQVEVLRQVVNEAQKEVTARKERLDGTSEKVSAAEDHIKQEKRETEALNDRRRALLGSIHSLSATSSILHEDSTSAASERAASEASVLKRKRELSVLEAKEHNALSGPQVMQVVASATGGAPGQAVPLPTPQPAAAAPAPAAAAAPLPATGADPPAATGASAGAAPAPPAAAAQAQGQQAPTMVPAVIAGSGTEHHTYIVQSGTADVSDVNQRAAQANSQADSA